MPNAATVKKMVKNGVGSGLWQGVPHGDPDPSIAHSLFDDFHQYDATNGWALAKDGTPTIATTDAAGGVLSIATQPTTPLNNDEVYVSSLREMYNFADGKRLWFEARVKLTEANVDDSNIIVGLSSSVAANTMVDNGAGPVATYDGATFFKVDGGTVWQTQVSNATAQTTDTNAGAFVSNQWFRLGFTFDGLATTGNIQFYLDGVKAGDPVTITNADVDEMHILFGVKCGASTQIETLLVDYVKCVQLR